MLKTIVEKFFGEEKSLEEPKNSRRKEIIEETNLREGLKEWTTRGEETLRKYFEENPEKTVGYKFIREYATSGSKETFAYTNHVQQQEKGIFTVGVSAPGTIIAPRSPIDAKTLAHYVMSPLHKVMPLNSLLMGKEELERLEENKRGIEKGIETQFGINLTEEMYKTSSEE